MLTMFDGPTNSTNSPDSGHVLWPCVVPMCCDHVVWPCVVPMCCGHVLCPCVVLCESPCTCYSKWEHLQYKFLS